MSTVTSKPLTALSGKGPQGRKGSADVTKRGGRKRAAGWRSMNADHETFGIPQLSARFSSSVQSAAAKTTTWPVLASLIWIE
jgi:hypothetical protein